MTKLIKNDFEKYFYHLRRMCPEAGKAMMGEAQERRKEREGVKGRWRSPGKPTLIPSHRALPDSRLRTR